MLAISCISLLFDYTMTGVGDTNPSLNIGGLWVGVQRDKESTNVITD